MSEIGSDLLRSLDRLVTAELFDVDAAQLTPELIRATIDDFRVIKRFSELSAADAELLARQLETRHAVRINIGGVVKLDHEPWLENAKTSIDPYYWSRYKRLLADDGFGVQVLATLDDVSDRVLGLLENPEKAGPWDRRGLVLGNVQSGKTANYLGLINKAADAGYRVIIVIAGIHNNLRNQTQSRIDAGFIGTEKGAAKNKIGNIVGVGKYDVTRRPSHFTSSSRDFSKAAAQQVGVPLQNLNEPAVFVIKKNANTLRNLLEWLESSLRGSRIDAPLLLIDDEADNASINVSQGMDGVSRINGQIRKLLEMFERSAYVGYTATPFANIFIDPDTDDEMLGQDLFPRDFIVSLDPPSNYVGAKKVFLEEPERFLRDIEDAEDVLPARHKISHVVEELPATLEDAVRSFVLVRAVRLARGQGSDHNSMLVNVSRFTNVQRQLRDEIHAFLEGIQDSLRVYGALPLKQARKYSVVAELERVFDTEFPDSGYAWNDIFPLLFDAAAPIRVVEVNSRAAGTLNYSEFDRTGLNVIAVGGFSLSRGLTLEGLSITYFLRNSMMYDTLMQMGRWFGYRPGYEDLCRIWMPEDAQGWYAHIAESVEILRGDLKEMESAGATPEDFGLRVRSHPDSLVVTARNKMGTGERLVVSVGLGDNLIETTSVLRSASTGNLSVVEQLIQSLVRDDQIHRQYGGSWLFEDVAVDPVLRFLDGFTGDPEATRTQKEPVLEYIRRRGDGPLASWDVLLVGRQKVRDEKLGVDDVGGVAGLELVYQLRTAGRQTAGDRLIIGNNQRVSSRGIERAGLPDEVVRQVEEEYRADSASANIPDNEYRAKRTKPLLMVHLLRMRCPTDKNDKPVLKPWTDPGLVPAWGISFPKPASYDVEDRVEYVVNMVWFREHFGLDVEDDDLVSLDD